MPSPDLEQKSPLPTVAEAEAIAALADPAQRNLQITQTYHDLNIAIARLLGETDVNWCTFATWASKTVGSFIRKEGAEAIIRQFFDDANFIEDGLAFFKKMQKRFSQNIQLENSFLIQVFNEVIDEIAGHTGHGNRIVFAELAPLFAKMIELFSGSTNFEQERLDELLKEIKTGPVSEGGQDMLIAAFTNYYEAIFVQDAKTKAELILWANLLVGYHEQTRLQAPIKNSMDAPVTSQFEKLFVERVLESMRQTTPWIVSLFVRLIGKRRLKRLAKKIADGLREITTEWIMTINLPDGSLKLGQDVPSLKSGKMFPANLQSLKNPELIALIEKIDRAPDTTKGSEARDWGNLDDRMNFIVDLFRSRQQDAILYQQPFTVSQVEVIRDGDIPDGPL